MRAAFIVTLEVPFEADVSAMTVPIAAAVAHLGEDVATQLYYVLPSLEEVRVRSQ